MIIENILNFELDIPFFLKIEKGNKLIPKVNLLNFFCSIVFFNSLFFLIRPVFKLFKHLRLISS